MLFACDNSSAAKEYGHDHTVTLRQLKYSYLSNFRHQPCFFFFFFFFLNLYWYHVPLIQTLPAQDLAPEAFILINTFLKVNSYIFFTIWLEVTHSMSSSYIYVFIYLFLVFGFSFVLFTFSKRVEVRLLDSPSPFWGMWGCWLRIQRYSCAFFSLSHLSTSYYHFRSQTHPHCNYPTMQCCLSSLVLAWYRVDLSSPVHSPLAFFFSFFFFFGTWACSVSSLFFWISFNSSVVDLPSVPVGCAVSILSSTTASVSVSFLLFDARQQLLVSWPYFSKFSNFRHQPCEFFRTGLLLDIYIIAKSVHSSDIGWYLFQETIKKSHAYISNGADIKVEVANFCAALHKTCIPTTWESIGYELET